jgi:16S rRNA processing protein RimM
MNKEELFCLGHTVKLHGYKGEFSIKLDVDEPNYYKNLESVFILLNEQPVPFFIEKISLRDKGFATVKFEGVDSLEQAENILGHELYLPLDQLPPLSGNKFYYHEVAGFRAIDKVHGDIGIVKQVLDFPAQAVLQIFKEEKEVLIPVTDEIITGIDRAEQSIFISAPEGLIEIYL